jgi:hypothetical protein
MNITKRNLIQQAMATLALSGVCHAVSATPTCTEAQPCTIDVMVAYTQAADDWAMNQSCSQLLIQDGSVDLLYDSISAVAIDGSGNPMSVDLEHPCSTNSELGNATDEELGHSPGIKNLIDISIAELNHIYRNSGLEFVQFNLASYYQIDPEYNEGCWLNESEDTCPDNWKQDNESLHTDAGIQAISQSVPMIGELVKARSANNAPEAMRNINLERKNVHADVVVVLVAEDYNEGADLSELAGISTGTGAIDPKNAFAVLDVSHATAPDFTFSHEVSHLIGAGHNELNNQIFLEQDPISPDGSTSNRGFARCETSGGAERLYRTVMSYGPEICAVVPYLSTPGKEIFLDGLNNNPAEFAILGTTERDNVSSVLNFAPDISNFGESLTAAGLIDRSNRIGIDLGYDTYVDREYKTLTSVNSYWGVWNNLTEYKKGHYIGAKAAGEEAIVTQTGFETAIVVEVSNSFASRNIQSNAGRVFASFGTEDFPPMAVADGFEAEFPWNRGELEISGLDTSETYSFRFFGGNQTITKLRSVKVEVKGANYDSNTDVIHNYVTAPNLLRTADISGIQPTSSGVITINVVSEGPWFWTRSGIGAMEFWPEY